MAGNIDSSLNFGMQNFLFTVSDETGSGGYYYYAYVTKKGSILIMRTDTNINNARYWIGTGTFTTEWANRATKSYKFPNELKDPNI